LEGELFLADFRGGRMGTDVGFTHGERDNESI
jgi:hypothetical protein